MHGASKAGTRISESLWEHRTVQGAWNVGDSTDPGKLLCPDWPTDPPDCAADPADCCTIMLVRWSKTKGVEEVPRSRGGSLPAARDFRIGETLPERWEVRMGAAAAAAAAVSGMDAWSCRGVELLPRREAGLVDEWAKLCLCCCCCCVSVLAPRTAAGGCVRAVVWCEACSEARGLSASSVGDDARENGLTPLFASGFSGTTVTSGPVLRAG